MRVYNFLFIFILIIYLLAIVGEQIMNKKEAGAKFSLLLKNNKSIETNEPRLILYGSSHCDFGLSAKMIEQKTKIKTLNLCNYGIEREKYSKYFLEFLLKNTRKNDIIIYAKIIHINENQLEEAGILGLLLPQFRTTISSLYRKYIKNIEDYDKFGDRVFYPIFNQEYKLPEYNIDYATINLELKKKIDLVLNNSNLKSKIFFTIAQILHEKDNLIDISKINYEFIKNCDYYNGIQSPLLIKNKNFFILAEHLNGAEGRNYWTENLIKYIYKNIL